MLFGLDQTLKDVGDLSDIAKDLQDIGETLSQLKALPCSLHPDRTIVAVAPQRQHARLCQECVDAFLENKNETGNLRRLGTNAIDGSSVDTTRLGASAQSGTGEESGAYNSEDVRAAIAGGLGGLGFWGPNAEGARDGATDSNSSGIDGNAERSGKR